MHPLCITVFLAGNLLVPPAGAAPITKKAAITQSNSTGSGAYQTGDGGFGSNLDGTGVGTGGATTPGDNRQAGTTNPPADIPVSAPNGQIPNATTPAPQTPPASGGAVVSAPQRQAAQQHQQAALDAYHRGDAATAEREMQLALQYDPNDPRLKALADMIIPHILTPMSDKTLKDRAAGLMAGSGGPGGMPEGGAILASPLALNAPRPPAPTAGVNPLSEYLKRDPAQDAMLKMRLKDYDGAEEALTRHLEFNPDDWLGYRTRALARRYLKKYQGSYDDATRALALNPKDGWSRDIRSATLTAMGRGREALADADEAIRLNAGDAGAYAARGEALESLGINDAALEALKRAAALDPQFSELYRSALRRREGPSGRVNLTYAVAGLGLLTLIVLLLGGRLAAAPRKATTKRSAMRAADRPPLPTGFEVVRRIGEGGMGVVYEAVDKGLERRVALKKMRDEIAADPRERRRFIKEARTVASLRHPNIVEIFSIVDEGPDLFLVFELLHGDTLDKVLGGRRLEPRRAAALTAQIAAALDHAHARGVIHQDLKPSNVLVAGEMAKVMDFGIARRPQLTMSTTERREIAGTPAYMAPEQERGCPAPASDVYSLGICVYEMLAGRTPFGGGGLMRKLTPDYPKLSAAGLPSALDGVLARALDPELARRFPTAGELARALAASLS